MVGDGEFQRRMQSGKTGSWNADGTHGIVDWSPRTRFRQPVGSSYRALPDQFPLMRGEAGEHREHQPSRRSGGIELLSHGAYLTQSIPA